jgi:hypothetical protein
LTIAATGSRLAWQGVDRALLDGFALRKQVCSASEPKGMRAYLALFVLLAASAGCLAGEIRKGATMQVKPNSIWFEETADLTHWQLLKKSGDAAALASFLDDKLHARDAWQFIKPLTVKVLKFAPETNQVTVEMKTEGRFAGTTWVLEADALVR